MSQVDQPSSRPTNQSETCVRPSASVTASATPPVQARQQFDAALQRAQDYDEDRPDPRPTSGPSQARKPRDNDDDTEVRDAFGALGPLNPFANLQNGLQPGAVPGAQAMMGGAATPMPTPGNQAGLSAESMPGQTIGGARQYNLNLAGEQAALHLRMTQASATHWQLRLSADAATRQQLGPHVERLRERLRERQQGQHTADFDLEDDIGG